MPIRFAPVLLAAAIAGGLVLPPALAQDGEPPQLAREALMDKNREMAAVVGDMLKGERPYDGAEATEALDVIVADLREFITLFPEDSKTGHDTRALPIIWEDWAGFEAANDEAIAAAEAARAVAADGIETLRPAFGALGNTCRSCHERFRAEE